MYEKRKYGTKTRYRITRALPNKSAKKCAAILREFGYPCQVDTWKSGFAIWADKRKIDAKVKRMVSNEHSTKAGVDIFFDVSDIADSKPKVKTRKEKKPLSLVYPSPYDKDVKAPKNKFDRFFWATTLGDIHSSDGLDYFSIINAASMFFKISEAEAKKLYEVWRRKAMKERKSLEKYYTKYPDEAPL